MKYGLIAFLGLMFLSANVQAQDAGLYAPSASPDSTFIRLINIKDNASVRPLRLNGKIFDGVPLGQATPYYAIRGGRTKIVVDKEKIERNAQRRNFYTAVDSKEGLVLIEDKIARKDKVQISFYNFGSKDPLILKANEGKDDITQAVAFGKAGVKDINPVKTTMALYNKDKKFMDVEQVSLVRGMAYTILLYDGTDGKPQIKVIEAATDTKR